MSYKITIEQIKEVTKIEQQKYQVIGQIHLTEEEYNSLDYGDRKSYTQVEALKPYIKTIYGNPPAQEVTRLEETKVLEQTVEDLDLPAVIRAINKL